MTPNPPAPFPLPLRALVACVGDGDARFAGALAAAVDTTPSLPHVAAVHGLTSLLYQRLRSTGLQDRLPSEQWEALKTSHVRRARGQQALLEMAADAVRLLQEAGVPCLPIKGLAQLVASGDDYLPRDMADVDLLLPADRIVSASRLLMASGWGEARLPWTLTPWTYGLPPLARGKNPLELHWRLWPVGPLLPYDLPSCAALAADAVPMPWAGVELPVPGVPAQIITVAAAMTVDALAVPLRHWADLYHLRRRLTNEGEERLWEMAAAARMTDYLRILLGLVAELWPEVGPGAPPGAQSDTVRRIAWRRLVHMPCETRRASSLLLLWRRLHGAGAQLDPAWRDKLPPELRAGVAAELAGEVLTQAGTSFVAGSKLLRRTGLWLASPAERQALREELALAEVLWGLAG